MMKTLVALLISLIFLTSCVDTSLFDSEYMKRDDVPLSEKLIYTGAEHVRVSLPECYYTGSEWKDRLVALIDSSEDYIFITTFLGSYSENLRPVYEALENAASRGVRIYLIYDGFSPFDMTESKSVMGPLEYLSTKGIHTLQYSPVSALNLINPFNLLIREHRKIFVFDGRSAAIGGMNLNYISMGAEGKILQRDSMYVFPSTALSSIFTDIFLSMWNDSSVETLSSSDFASYPPQFAPYDAYVYNSTGDEAKGMSGIFSALINSAEDEIIIFPYLPALDDEMKKALSDAVERGVDVTFIQSLDTRGYGENGQKMVFPDLLELGINLVIANNEDDTLGLLHEKLMVVDGRYSVIGSSNFNYRSMGLSNEIVMVIDSTEFASLSKEHISNVLQMGSFTLDEEMAERWKEEDGSLAAYLMIYFGG